FEGYEQYLSKPKADSVHIIRYFPRSGGIQVFGSFDPVTIFLRYLSECSLPEFSSVELVAYALESVDGIHEILPFPIKYIKNDAGDIHSKIAIIFTSKILFLQKLFSNPYDFGDFICDAPIPDCER
ncbi:3551_t:CDS:2, partial [Rhizophagus irregularis]